MLLETVYPITIKDLPERKATIKDQLIPNLVHHTSFKDEEVSLEVARVEIGLPLYRMANTRTVVEQLDYISTEDKPENFFRNGQENLSAQKVQHTFLYRLSRDPKAPVYEELAYSAKQTMPILATSSGVVVDGNRRLSAMRELYMLDSSKYKAFSHVNIAVLPDTAVELDLEVLESELQERKDMKLPYQWIPRRLKMRYRRDTLKIPVPKLIEMYRFKRPEQLNEELAQLDLAEEFLESIGESKHYKRVEKDQQVFSELQSAIQSHQDDPDKAELAKRVAFILIKNKGEIKGRKYDYRRLFDESLDRMLRLLAMEREINLDPQAGSTQASPAPASGRSVVREGKTAPEQVDPLDELLPEEESPFAPLKEILDPRTAPVDLAKQIAAIGRSLDDEDREEDKKRIPINRAIEAANILQALDLEGFGNELKQELVQELNKIRNRVDDLLQVLSDAGPARSTQ